MARCDLCEEELRDDKAFMDAGWHTYVINMKDKTLCPGCEKMIAQAIIDAY